MTSAPRLLLPAAAAVFLCHLPVTAFAQAPGGARACAGPLDAERAVRCALAGSPEVASARLELEANAGRRLAAGVLLPSRPELSGTVSRRAGPDESAINWSVALAQEIELPGERAARLEEVDAERAAALQRLQAVERDTAVATLNALYGLAAAEEMLALADDLSRGAAAVASAMAARAAEGLLPPFEADLAAADEVRLSLARAEAESRRALARAQLTVLLALPNDGPLPALAAGLLTPGPRPPERLEPLLEWAARARVDLAAARAELLSASARIERLRRERTPKPILSAFAQRDGFDEWVLGGGLAIPVPLPSPLGPSGEGEIRAAEAMRGQTEQQLEALRRRVRQEVERSLGQWRARRAVVDRFTPALVERARAHVGTLAAAVKDRQLSPREALGAERTFIELLQGHVEARLAEALARVELARAAGRPLPGVTP